MTEAQKHAYSLRQTLLTKQPNLIKPVPPDQAGGEQLADFVDAFIKTYATKREA